MLFFSLKLKVLELFLKVKEHRHWMPVISAGYRSLFRICNRHFCCWALSLIVLLILTIVSVFSKCICGAYFASIVKSSQITHCTFYSCHKRTAYWTWNQVPQIISPRTNFASLLCSRQNALPFFWQNTSFLQILHKE